MSTKSVKTQFKKGVIPWNKGLSVRLNPKGEFKKGLVPWNVGMKWPFGGKRKIKILIDKVANHTQKGKLCLFCKKLFWLRSKPKKKFCSRTCAGKDYAKKHKILFQCKKCGVGFERNKSWSGKGDFCSRICCEIFRVKENSPSWRGGIKKENDRRKSFEGVQWRKAVFERDNYTCVICKTKGGYLEADHIKPYALFPTLRYVLSNGRTVCKSCHRKTPTYGARTRKAKII